MNRQRNAVIVLFFILVILLLVLFGVKKTNEWKSEGQGEAVDTISVTDFAADDVSDFSYTSPEKEYSLEKKDGIWYVAEDHSLTVTQYRISNMLARVTPLKAVQVISDVTDWAQYGLENSAKSIVLHTSSGTYKILIGDKNELTGNYYVRIDDTDCVDVVEEGDITVFDVSIADVTETEEESEVSSETEESEISPENKETLTVE